MKILLFVFSLILAFVLRLSVNDGNYMESILGTGSVFGIWLIARYLPTSVNFFPEICALLLAISPWHILISKYTDINFLLLFTTLGIYIFFRFLKKYVFLTGVVFLLVITLVISKDSFFGFSNTQVPIWLTDEQRREHGNFYNHPVVVLAHNKVANYSLSFLDHYTQHFQGDFLFISGDVRDGSIPHLGLMYFFDFIFITTALILIIKNPKGWGIIFLWLSLAPLPSALDFQPPNALKAYLMIVPLTILSAFGASYIFKKTIKV